MAMHKDLTIVKQDWIRTKCKNRSMVAGLTIHSLVTYRSTLIMIIICLMLLIMTNRTNRDNFNNSNSKTETKEKDLLVIKTLTIVIISTKIRVQLIEKAHKVGFTAVC